MRSILVALTISVAGVVALAFGLAVLLQWLDQLTSLRFPVSAADHAYLEVEVVPHFHEQTQRLDVWYIEQGLLAKKRRQLLYQGFYPVASLPDPTPQVDITRVAATYGPQQQVLLTLAGQPLYHFRPELLTQPARSENL